MEAGWDWVGLFLFFIFYMSIMVGHCLHRHLVVNYPHLTGGEHKEARKANSQSLACGAHDHHTGHSQSGRKNWYEISNLIRGTV